MRFVAALIVPLLGALAFGHTDISTTIKRLTEQIAEEPSAPLYYQRATEYRALREKKHALEDLRAALTIDPGHAPAKIALIEALGQSDEALSLARQLASGPPKAASAIDGAYLLAHIHRERGELRKAFEVCRKLCQKTKGPGQKDTEIDLLYAHLLLDLDRPADAAASLKSAWKQSHSIVLRNQWIDVALTAGLTGEVLPIIEKELNSSRLRSSWLIRRARARLALGRTETARADLRAALHEIGPRINPTRPDLTLIADRGLAHALMGHPERAKSDLKTLRKSTFPPSSYRLLADQLAFAK